MMYLALNQGGSPESVHDSFDGALVALGAVDPKRWLSTTVYCHGRLAERVVDADGFLRGWIMDVERNPDNSVGKRGVW